MKELKVLISFYGKLTLCFLLGFFTMSCEKENLDSAFVESANASVNSTNLVQVNSTGLNFDAPEEIPSGWTTFVYKNKTGMVHFFAIEKMPFYDGEQKTIENTRQEVLGPFQSGMDYYRAGNFGGAFGPQGFGGLPDWLSELEIMGGTGLVDPGKTTNTTVYMEPGIYLIECYVKSPNGEFHTINGMLHQFVVTSEENNKKEPKADIEIKISSTSGITMDQIKRPGKHTFSVFFKDQKEGGYGNLVGHDVHLVKFDETVDEHDKKILNYWMNWLYVDFANEIDDLSEGLIAPVPKGFSFIGGTQELPAGRTSYFDAVLKPGKYALISEIDDPMKLNPDTEHGKFYREFTVE